MATATFEEELLSAPSTYNYSRTPSAPAPSFNELLGMLNYNQGLVEFADSKAGSLILLNSLLIAAIGALPSTGNLGTFKLASVVLCSAAVYVCFQVISSKDESEGDNKFAKRRKSAENWERNDFIFFGCIQGHKTGDDYTRSFGESDDNGRRRALLQRTYVISKIASRKFAQYKTAQQITSAALVVWVAVNLLPFVAA